MVGMFSRFYVSRGGHRRAQSAVDEVEVLPPSLEATSAATMATHSVEIAFELKPVAHPMEPLDLDRPIQCPLPEPSMLNEGSHGRIWKEQVRKPDGPLVHVPSSTKSETQSQKPRPVSSRAIVPSISAPESHILKLLEECNASAM